MFPTCDPASVPVVRVVLLGKGGSGKSTLAGLLAAALIETGEQVVALDADSVPGLSQVLGMPATDDWFLAGMAERKDGGWSMAATHAEIVRRRARQGPGGLRFVQLGNADASVRDFEFRREAYPDQWSGTVAFNTIARSFDEEDGWVVVDLQGGTLQVAGGMVGRTGIALLVVEPFAKSLLTARRFVDMGPWPPGLRLLAVANKVAKGEDEAYIESELDRLGLPLWASIPLDPTVLEAERAGQPLVSLDHETPIRQAVATMVDRLRQAPSRADRVSAASSG